MSRRHFILAVAVAIAAWLAFFGDKTPQSAVVEPVARTASASASASAYRAPGGTGKRATDPGPIEPLILALVPRDILMDGAQAEKPMAVLFDGQSWTPPPPPPPPPQPVAPPPPTAPPLPFKYLGKKSEENQWEVYLARGEQTLIVQEQTVIDGTYRIDAIKPPVLSLTYLPLNQAQTLTIGGTD